MIEADVQSSETTIQHPIQAWFGGLDRSGEPNLVENSGSASSYVTVIAVATFLRGDPSPLSADFERLRQHYGIRSKKEFHAHRLPEEIQCAALEVAQIYELAIGAVIIDKARTIREWEVGLAYPTASELREGATFALLEAFFRRYQLNKLWIDEDVRGAAANEERTGVYRIHRSIWPEAKLHCRHKSSSDNEMIQLADIAAYILHANARGSIRTERLRRLANAFWADTRHVLLGPAPWTPFGIGGAPLGG